MARTRKNGTPANFDTAASAFNQMAHIAVEDRLDAHAVGELFGEALYFHLALAVGLQPPEDPETRRYQRMLADWSPADHAAAAVVGLARAGQLTSGTVVRGGEEALINVVLALRDAIAGHGGIDEGRVAQIVQDQELWRTR